MDKKIMLKTISIKDLWNVLRGCFLLMIVAAVICTAVFYVVAKINYVPVYSSTATLYLIGDYGDDYSYEQYASDYNIAFRIITEANHLLKSRNVLDKVGEAIGIENGYAMLNSRITISNPEDTRVFVITATGYSPEQAKAIVDNMCTIGAESINDVFYFDKFRVIDPGTYNENPINAVSLTGYLKFGIVAAAAVYIVFLAMFLFDNYIHTEEDIDRYLGVSILGDIPDADAPKKKSKYTNYKKHDSKVYGVNTDNKEGRT